MKRDDGHSHRPKLGYLRSLGSNGTDSMVNTDVHIIGESDEGIRDVPFSGYSFAYCTCTRKAWSFALRRDPAASIKWIFLVLTLQLETNIQGTKQALPDLEKIWKYSKSLELLPTIGLLISRGCVYAARSSLALPKTQTWSDVVFPRDMTTSSCLARQGVQSPASSGCSSNRHLPLLDEAGASHCKRR